MASGHTGSSGEAMKGGRASFPTGPSRAAVNAIAYAWTCSSESSRLEVYAAVAQHAQPHSLSFLLPNAAVASGTPFDGLQVRAGHTPPPPPSSCLGPSPLPSSPSGGYHPVVSGIYPLGKRPLAVDDDPQEDPSNKKIKGLARDAVAPYHSCHNEDVDDQLFDYHTGSSCTVALSPAQILAPQTGASITNLGKRPCEGELQKDASNKKTRVFAGEANSLESIVRVNQMMPGVRDFLRFYHHGLQNEHILGGTSSAAPAPGAINLSSSGAQDGVLFQREFDDFLHRHSLARVDVNVLAERIEYFYNLCMVQD